MENRPERPEGQLPFLLSLIGTARELILDVDERRVRFTVICLILDSKYMDVDYNPAFTIEFEGSAEERDNEAKEILAVALALDVPVYPNDDSAVDELARLHENLMTSGFRASSTSEKPVHLIPTMPRGVQSSSDHVEYLPSESITPGDVIVARARQHAIDEEQQRAARVLASLRSGIERLGTALDAEERNEQELQDCLTAYPVLFGLEYAGVEPEYKLGKEYIADYALVRHSGLVDLVEIEASSHPLYTKSANPSAALTHAEQQILDWLDWLTEAGHYGRRELGGLISPVGYVVIGSIRTLSPDDRARLRRRNLSWRGTLMVLTYEDLLERAEGILSVLVRGESRPEQGGQP